MLRMPFFAVEQWWRVQLSPLGAGQSACAVNIRQADGTFTLWWIATMQRLH